jgi:hypothetical protein
MKMRARFTSLARGALLGWLVGCVALAPYQFLEAARNAGWSSAHSAPGLFAEVIVLSILLWAGLTFAVSTFFCCIFIAPMVWNIAPERVLAHRLAWALSWTIFGIAVIALRAHIWTAFNHDGVGLANFWLWAAFACAFFAVTAESYHRAVRSRFP